MKIFVRLAVLGFALVTGHLGTARAAHLSVLATFDLNTQGSGPCSIIQGKDGNFYGTTLYGTIFKMTPGGVLTKLATVTTESSIPALNDLVEGDDGNFYGTARYSPTGFGSVYRVTPEGTVTTLAVFNGTNGKNPLGGLTRGRDGSFYGTTQQGGTYVGSNPGGYGTVFKMTPAGTLTTLFSFRNDTAFMPRDGVTEGRDGQFYGITQFPSTSGTLYKVSPSGVYTTVHLFNETDGYYPFNALGASTNDTLYGTTVASGLSGPGTFFSLSPYGLFTKLFTYSGPGIVDQRLVVSQGGQRFYGTTGIGSGSALHGGSNDSGNGAAIFSATATGTVEVLATISGYDSYARIIMGRDGKLYGTATTGTQGANGFVFRIDLTPVPQTISFISPLGPQFVGRYLNTVAISSSGLPVEFSLISGPATANAYFFTTGAGTVKLAARQAGNSEYKPVEKILNVQVRKSPQTITPFEIIPSQVYPSAPFTINLPTSPTGDVTVAVKSGPATLSGNTLTLTGKGSVTLIATQPGNVQYEAARAVTTSFLVTAAK